MMVKRFIILLIPILLGFSDLTPEQHRYEHLVKTFRCVTCPNQNIQDSFAPVAMSMKDEIRKRIQSNASDTEIRDYLVARYGEYIDYRPPVNKQTSVLWFGPYILLALGLIMWFRLTRQSK